MLSLMIPLWLPLTLLSAFFLASSDALTKKVLADHNEYLVTWPKAPARNGSGRRKIGSVWVNPGVLRLCLKRPAAGSVPVLRREQEGCRTFDSAMADTARKILTASLA